MPSTKLTETERIVVPRTLENPHPITRRTAAAHGGVLELPWDGVEPDRTECFDISVSDVYRERALLLIDTLLKACEARGFELRHDPAGSHRYISIFVDGEPFLLRLAELGYAVTYLAFQIGEEGGGKTWKDNSRGRIERRLNEIVRYLQGCAATRIAARREREDSERRLAELERKRAELREEVMSERKDFDLLISEAESWRKAKAIRAYTAALKAWAKHRGTLADYAERIEWACSQADRLDPLCDSPPSVLDTPRREWRELRDHEFLEEDGSIGSIWE